MKVLITGASGFVGKNILSYFSSDANIEFISVNLRRSVELSGSFSGVHAYLHLAGKAHDLRNISLPSEYFAINTSKTQEVFESYLASSAKYFIFVSSVKAVADVVSGNELLEDDFPNPITPYGQSKLAAENFLKSQILPNEKEVFILRPCMIHGPGNNGNLNLLFNFVKTGMPWPLGAFENKRSFLSIDNFCHVVGEILAGNVHPGVYNLADSEPLSTNSLIRIIAQETNRSTKIWSIPKGVIVNAAKVGDYFNLPLNSERLHKLTDNYVVSNQKLLQALGKPLPVTAHEGLRKTIKSFT